MSTGDLLLLTWGAVCLFLPGATLLATLRKIPVAIAVAGAPVVTLGLLYLTSLVGGLTGIGYGIGLVLAVWVVVLAVGIVLGRGRQWGGILEIPRRSALRLVGLGGTALAVALGVMTWVRGLGGLGTIPQEHDIIIHGELVARVMATGEGAPWQSFPVDLMSGEPAGFYPNGFHLYAGLTGSLGADPVSALNAAMVVLLAVAMPVGVAALGTRVRPRHLGPLIGAAAALVAAVAYRPLVALMHDGGILSNATAFAIGPGAVATILVAGRMGAGGILPIALLVCGAVVLHPTSVVTIGVTAGVWLIALLFSRAGRRSLKRTLTVLVVGGLAGGVGLVPLALAAAPTATTVTEFPRDFSVTSLRDAVGLTLTAPYGGFLDEPFALSQSWIFVLSVTGLVVCLVLRANAAVVAAYGVWAVVLMGFLMDWPVASLQAIHGIYYNSYVRITGGLALMQWLASGVAIAIGVEALARLFSRIGSKPAMRTVRPVLAGLALLATVLVVTLPYARINANAIAERYRDPTFIRTDEFDLAAAAYVAERIRPGDRVMNNANDGSSYGYVYHRLPLVQNAALGSNYAPYTVELLQDFNEFADDRRIKNLVCDLRISWAIVDDEAPPIWAPTARYPWVPGGYLSVPPGLKNLDEVPHVEEAARFGDVSVFEVDLDGLGCAEPSN